MSLPGRLIGTLVTLAVLGLLAAGVYLRLDGEDSGDGNAQEASGDDLPGVSAADAFDPSVPIAVEGVPVVKDTLILGVKASGHAAAYRQTAVVAQVAGTVRSVPVRENSVVGAGALVVQLDSAEHQLELDQAVAQLEQARNTFRELTLWDDRIQDPSVRASREDAARLKANLDGSEIAVERALLNLRRTRVASPFAGRVANLRVVPGQYVTTGTELLTIVDIDPIKVEVDVLEADIGHVAPGRSAQITLAALPGHVFSGRIETINPVVDQVTRTARVTVVVPNPSGQILPGMYARVTLDARRMPDRVLVPREAVLERDGRTLVFLFQGEGTTGTAQWQYVSTGLMNDLYVEIIHDTEDSATRLLEAGEIVLVDGHRTLSHAAPIRLVPDAAAEGGRPR